ncbi:NADH-quinone oxidoreductase subunit J [Candidatus Thiothrix sp. Deng01]|uniref:NADH-quinone oxidoreductase subunit J n=1 Tax=Candidatus Thiothrix phosphatis TaxID=3112415 RepID=A0ABU6D041_9GAMM|nr:NADH-quinone oxidoreductase subunit J [Candidatus Thiothrix sp. Deng01]MEB4592437.1 NADH-quinone oxidoreductase subunit J [Candidatus Thiothrix sp. Deng01]
MTFEQLIFYLFSATLVAAAVNLVTVRNPVYAALSLILCFFTSSALWLLLEAEFLGIVLVLVYVGAVMVLFLFVIMMLDLNLDLLKEGFTRYLPIGLLVAVVVAVEMILVVNSGPFQAPYPAAPAPANNTEALGSLLYTEYVYPFEIAAVILVVAIIAAIVLTLRRRPDARKQDISQQVQVRRADRVRLVKMKSERSE